MINRSFAYAVTSVLAVGGLAIGCESRLVTPSVSGPNPNLVGVTAVVPTVGQPGRDLNVTGWGFKPGATVTMGGASAEGVFVNATRMTARAPLLPNGPVDVVVTNPGNESSKIIGGFTYEPFTLTSVSPSAGLPGDNVRIFGTGVGPDATVTIGGVLSPYFDGGPCGTTFACNASVPEHRSGLVDVVLSQDGQSATLTDAYEYQSVTLSVDSTEIALGGPLTVTWTGPFRPANSAGEDIGLYETGSNAEVWSLRLSIRQPGRVASGTRTLTALIQPGQYEFRYQVRLYDNFDKLHVVVLARSSAVTVSKASLPNGFAGESESRQRADGSH